jgi:hypothetical protein
MPAFPTEVFKKQVVASFPIEEAVFANLTSGTTSANARGRVFRDEIGKTLTFEASRVMTAAYLFPDFDVGQRCRILILAPSPKMAPSMGMALGMEETRRIFGTADSRFLLGRSGIDVRALIDALEESQSTGVPVALIGSTSAFVYFLLACKRKKRTFRLPPGSRVCDGGGYRGRFGDVTRDDYYGLVEGVLGIPSTHCVNVLGMAETATNYFDSVLRDCVRGRPGEPRHKPIPPWTRVIAAGVEDLSPLPPGEIGLLRHYDLCGLPTVIGVQSDNLGYTDDAGGFEIVGRAKVVDGRVTTTPDSVPVSPMGSRPVFRLLEKYVNFSIDLKMNRPWRRERGGPTAEIDQAEPGSLPSCPSVVDDLVAAEHDPEAARRADSALAVFERLAASDPPQDGSREDGKDTGTDGSGA